VRNLLHDIMTNFTDTLLALPITPKRVRKSLIETKIFKINEEINKITSNSSLGYYDVVEIAPLEQRKSVLIDEYKKLEN
jgi:hypothetical protein